MNSGGAAGTGDVVIESITPEATEAERAAICVAYELLWPTAPVTTPLEPSPRWRYAGRPWRRRAQYGGWT